MAKITTLPEGTMERIPQFIGEAIERHKKQYPIDIKEVVAVGRELFDGSKTKDIFLVHQSEKQAIDTAHIILSDLNAKLGANLDANLDAKLDANLGANLCANLANLGANVASLSASLSDNLANLDAKLRANLCDNLGANLGAKSIPWTYFTNYWRWYYAEFYEFCAEFVPTDKALLEKQRRYLNAFPFFFCLQIGEYRIFFVYECPTIRTTPDYQIHNDHGLAIEWNDGTGYYYLDGVKLDEALYNRIVSQKMTFSEIMKIEISDQRTVALKYNPQAIINENAVLVHKDERGNELYCIEGKEINKITNFPKMYFVKMPCPTGRVFVEGISPDFAEAHPNATECQAELCSLTLTEYGQLLLES